MSEDNFPSWYQGNKPFDISRLPDYKQAKNGKWFYKYRDGSIKWVPRFQKRSGRKSI